MADLDETGRYDIEGLQRLVERDAGCPEFPALAEAYRRQGRPEEARRISERGLEEAPERMAGRVSLGLALIDLGKETQARAELAGILEALLEPHRLEGEAALASLEGEPPAGDSVHASGVGGLSALPVQDADRASGFGPDVASEEIEHAFEHARSEPEQMVSPNRMAEQVLLEHAPADDLGASDDLGDAFDVESAEPYRTQTMAALLERQGDHSGAQAIRETLDGGAPAGRAQPPAAGTGSEERPGEEGDGSPRSRRSQILSTLESWLNNLQGGAA